jgi:hypothetical protein
MKDLQRALLTREDVASAIGTSANGIREMTGVEALEVSRIVSVEGCAGAGGTSGPSGLSGHWQAGVFYTFLDGDRERTSSSASRLPTSRPSSGW